MSKTYEVTIRATVIKTLKVEAKDEDDAITEAYETFSVLDICDDDYYDEQLEAVKEVRS
jgi:hypothetical protein